MRYTVGIAANKFGTFNDPWFNENPEKKTSWYEVIETDDVFEWLDHEYKKKYKPRKDDNEYLIFADFKEVEEYGGNNPMLYGKRFARAANNVAALHHLLIDLDDLEEQGEILTFETMERLLETMMGDIQYRLWPSFSYDPETPNLSYRVLVRVENPITSNAEKLAACRQFFSMVALEMKDGSNKTLGQKQGAPLKGRPYTGGGKSALQNEKVAEKVVHINRLNPRSTSQKMTNYVQREEENLLDRSNWLNALCVLAKSVRTGEISLEYGRKYAKQLALGNVEWESDSLDKLEELLQEDEIRTPYTFEEKFGYYTKEEELLPTIECANLLMEKYQFLNIGTDQGPLFGVYLEKEGIYATNTFLIQRLIYREEPNYTERQVNDVLFKIKMRAEIQPQTTKPYLIPVANGVYNMRTGQLEAFSPSYVFTTKIATKYNATPQKPAWDVDKWFEELACGDPEVIQLMWELINEAVNGNYTRGKYFVLVGDGRNGKSSFQDMLVNLIGHENVASLRMKELNERFKPFELLGKTLNIGDDIQGEYIEDSSNLQSITTGERVTLEQKGKDPVTAELKLALLFSANDMPKFRNKTDGAYRRIIIIPFDAKFDDASDDPTIREEKIKQTEVLEYILHKALQLGEFRRFTIPERVQQALDDFKEENDPVRYFYNSVWVDHPYTELDKVPTAEVFRLYKNFCQDNLFKPVTEKSFTPRFLKLLGDGYIKKKAKPERGVFVYEGSDKYGSVQCFIQKGST